MTRSISRESLGEAELHILRDGDARATVVPAWGAGCIEWEVGGAAVLEPADRAEIARKPTSFGIPLLLPFPNRLRDGTFSFGGERFAVEPGRHGFVRDKAWKVIDSGTSAERGAWITCGFDAADHGDAILHRYPFPFRVEATYELAGSTLKLLLVVHNTGARTMPFGFGIHPYFARPARGTVTVPAAERWELADSLPTGRRVPVDGAFDLRHPRDVAALSLDDIYTGLDADADGLVRCRIDDLERGVRTTVEFDPAAFPDVVVYTAPAPRRAICIEPYTCPTDAFNLIGRGVDEARVSLPAGQRRGLVIAMHREPIEL